MREFNYGDPRCGKDTCIWNHKGKCFLHNAMYVGRCNEYCLEKQEHPVKEPPLGLSSRSMHDDNRIVEIMEAMIRYIKAEEKIPKEWYHELNSLIEYKMRKEW